MKRVIFWILLLLPCYIKCAQVEEKLNSALQNPAVCGASIGIEIVANSGGNEHKDTACRVPTNETSEWKTIYSYNSEKLLIPASNAKIITALAALTLLKPEYRFKTEIYWDSINLYIKGYGDPTLSISDLEEISDKIIEYGIKKIENIFYDDTYFDKREISYGWVEENEAYGFNAKISALSLNKNCIKLFIKPRGNKVNFILYPKTDFVQVINTAVAGEKDSLYVERKLENDMNIVTLKGTMKKGGAGETFVRHIDKPALYTTTIFKEILQKNGVEINGKLMPKESLDTCNLLYSHFSEPLIHLVYDMNKGSLNFYADQLIKTIGAEMQGTPGSFEKGIAEVEKFLKTLGLNEEEFRIYDGSGLSRYNLISAHGIVKILLKALELDIKAEFLTSLPIAGVDGTLKGRLKSSNTIGKVRAKTGTMMNTSSLSGYTTTSQKTPVVFSIIINNYTCPPQVIKELQDKIIELIISEI